LAVPNTVKVLLHSVFTSPNTVKVLLHSVFTSPNTVKVLCHSDIYVCLLQSH